mgnify:CR=1 FL=1
MVSKLSSRGGKVVVVRGTVVVVGVVVVVVVVVTSVDRRHTRFFPDVVQMYVVFFTVLSTPTFVQRVPAMSGAAALSGSRGISDPVSKATPTQNLVNTPI